MNNPKLLIKQRKPSVYVEILLLVLLALFFSVKAMAQAVPGPNAVPIHLIQGQNALQAERQMRFSAGKGRSLQQMVDEFEVGGFVDTFDDADQGMAPREAIWAAANVTNSSPEKKPVPDRWVVTSAVFAPLEMDIYLIRASGNPELLLAHDYMSYFEPAERSLLKLRSQPMSLVAGEQALLMVRIVSGPERAVDFDILTESSLADDAFLSGMWLAAFYAFSGSLLLFFFGFHASLRNIIGVGYAGLFALGLVFIAYLDGFPFRFLYPQYPTWNLPVGLIILNLLSACSFYVAGLAMKTKDEHHRFTKPVQILAVLPVLTMFLIPVLSRDTLVGVTYLWALLMYVPHIVATGWWRKLGGRKFIMSQFIAIGMVIAMAVLFILLATGGATDRYSIPLMIKLIFAVFGMFTMSGLTIEIVSLRRENERATQLQMQALVKEAQQSRKLFESEKNYARARDQANFRQRQLATASHDIKQSLSSLRMNLGSISTELGNNGKQNIGKALDYLESLSGNYLEEARPADSNPQHPLPNEVYQLSIVLNAAQQMFHEEAVSKQLQLRVVDSSMETDVPALVLMRIVSNLISNAIKFTDSGRVLVGVRRREKRGIIEVFDTGRGMSKAEVNEFQSAYQKGDQSDGEGLGLAICGDLAKQHGLRLEIVSQQDQGTRIRIILP